MITLIIFLIVAFILVIEAVSLWGKTRQLQVDFDLITLGFYYVAVICCYLVFEMIPLNYRPILIDGRLEASYPSSTTMLALCVMPTAALQLHRRVGKALLRKIAVSACVLFTVFMVAGRLISGVHWLTDIIGGVLVSAGLVLCYAAFCEDK